MPLNLRRNESRRTGRYCSNGTEKLLNPSVKCLTGLVALLSDWHVVVTPNDYLTVLQVAILLMYLNHATGIPQELPYV